MATCKQENQFLPSQGEGEGPGKDGVPPSPPPPPQEWGKEPDALEYSVFEGGIHIGDGIAVALRLLLGVRVKDARGRPVRAPIEWLTIDRPVADLSRDGVLEAKTKGNCEVWFETHHHRKCPYPGPCMER